MSTTVDERVVEMRFDNGQFEKNVSTTMSTLDKLKQKLNLTGASKGLEDVNAAANKVNMSGLGSAVETVRAKFSALEVMGVTALANITNSAVNAGKRLVAAFTIDPVKTGFQEYELKMNSVQTIMASTGESLDTVNKYLDELNEYSDKTIYSFSDMTTNIGKFTNAGVKLEDAVLAIKGISNEAAVSGANANEASHAMYNFAQALSAGYVKLIDWKSIENANMATVEFKNQLIQSAVAAGTLTEASDGMYKTLGGNLMNATTNFNDTLQDQWMTTEVLVNTLKDYADEATDIGKKAYSSAQDVKTFSMMMDTLKESAQSGWAQTWEIIVGDFEESKSLFTTLSNFFGKIIETSAEFRNKVLKGALGSKWDKFVDKINEAGISTDEFSKKLKDLANDRGIRIDDLIEEYGSLEKVISKGYISTDLIIDVFKSFTKQEKKASKATEDITDKLEYFQNVVNQVWNGDFKNGEDRIKALTETGYDYAKVQELVNKTIDGHKLTLEDLSDTQLESIGYTNEQIKKIRELADEAEKAGTPISDLIKDMSKPTGRELLIDSFRNIGSSIVSTINIIKEAWGDVFGAPDSDKSSDTLYNLIDMFHQLTASMQFSEETATRFQNILEGVFSALDISWSLASVSLIGGLKILNELFKIFGTDVGEVLEKIAGYITDLNNWIEDNTIFGAESKWNDIARIIAAILEGIRDCVKAFLELDESTGIIESISTALKRMFDGIASFLDRFNIDNVVESITNFFDSIEAWIRNGHKFTDLGSYLMQGLQNGITDGIKGVGSAILSACVTLLTKFKEFFGIHSPSTVFIAMGGFIIAGLIIGILASLPNVRSTIYELGGSILDGISGIFSENSLEKIKSTIGSFTGKIAEIVSNIDLGGVLAIGLSAGMLAVIKQLADAIKLLGTPLKSINGVITSIGGFFDSLKDYLKAKQWQAASEAIKNAAIAILILAGALFLISKIDPNRLWASVGALAVIAAIMTGLTVAMGLLAKALSKTGNIAGIAKLAGLSTALLFITGAIALLAVALKQLSTIEPSEASNALQILAFIFGGVIALFATSIVAGKYAGKAGSMVLLVSVAMLIMVKAIKQISEIDQADLNKGLTVIALLGVMLGALIAFSKLAGQSAGKAGGMLLMVSASLLMMLGVIKIASSFSNSDLVKGVGTIASLLTFFGLFISLSKIIVGKDQQVIKIGGTLLAISSALLITVTAMKMIADLSGTDITKGLGVITTVGVIFGALIAISKFSGENAAKAGVMLLMMSGALLLVSGVLFVISKMNPSGLGRALGIITALSAIFASLIVVSHLAKDCYQTIMQISIALALLVGSLVVLYFLDETKLNSAIKSLSIVMGMLSLLIASTGLMKTGKDATKQIATVGILVAALSGLVYILSIIDNPDNAIKSSEALAILMGVLIGTLMLIGKIKVKPVSKTLIKEVSGLLVVMTAFGLILSMMSALDSQNAIQNAVGLTILMTALIGTLKLMSSVKLKPVSKTLIQEIGGLLVLMTAFGLILAMMSGLNTKNAIQNAIALSILSAAMTLMLTPLSTIGKSAKNAVSGVIALTAIAVPLVAFVAILALIQNVQIATENVVALVALASAMTLLLVPLTMIGNFVAPALLGVASLTAIAVPLLAFVGVLALMQNVQNALSNVLALTALTTAMTLLLIPLTVIGALVGIALLGVLSLTSMAIPLLVFVGIIKNMEGIQNGTANVNMLVGLMTIMTNLLLKVSIVAPLALLGVVALTALSLFIAGFVTFAVGIGALVEKFPKLEEFIDKGIPILVKLAGGIGAFIGAIVGGTAAGIMSILPGFAMSLSLFMSAIQPFVIGASNIDGSVLEGVANLSAAILLLTIADFVSGILTLGGLSLVDTGLALSEFMSAVQPFLDGVSQIDPTVVESVSALAQAILLLTAADLISGIANFGDSDISDFASQLEGFGDGVAKFADKVKNLDDDTLKAVRISANAGKALAEMAASLPNSGGMLGKIFGENDMDTFGTKLEGFGTSLTMYGKSVANLNVEAVNNSIPAAEGVAELAEKLPNSGGWIGTIFGENDMDTFGTKLEGFGTSLTMYGKSVANLNVEAVNNSIPAAESLVKLADIIPNDGGWWGKIFGDNDIGSFGEKLAAFGGAMQSYGRKVSDMNASDVEKSVDIVNDIIDMIDRMTGVDLISGPTSFLNAIGILGNLDLEKFGKVSTSMTSTGTKMIESLTKGLENSQVRLKTSIQNIIAGMINTIGNNKTKFTTAGIELVGKLTSGVESSKSWGKKAIATVLRGMITTIYDYQTSFYNAGSNLVSGFANGINDSTWKAEAKAKTMAEAAEKAAKDALDINSPSKVFRRLGYRVPEGFAQGIERMSKYSSSASESMADDAIINTKGALARMLDVINSDIDAQPTIRPVLDLSDVTDGANSINGMFSMRPSVGLLTDVGAINSMMNNKIQNGGNGDVISAIKDLKDSISNSSGNVYSINGITYDDGSNVSNAVEALMRAARMERRI